MAVTEPTNAQIITPLVDSAYYQTLYQDIPTTEKPLQILVLGSVHELGTLFTKVPHACLTCVDNSADLSVPHSSQVTILQSSCLDHPWGDQTFDYIISSLSLHYYTSDIKVYFYRRLHAALRPQGKYIEGDYIVTPEIEAQKLDAYFEIIQSDPDAADGARHIDIPFSLTTQKQLFIEAGFSGFQLIAEQPGIAVYAVMR